MSEIHQNPALIIESDKKLHTTRWLLPLAALTIYSLIFPIVLLDISVTIYQWIYFTALRIPKVNKKSFVRMERWDLSKLNPWQKINCVYCEYANGVLAWSKAVGVQTEIYSCAIKHRHALKDHEQEKKYYEEKRFN